MHQIQRGQAVANQVPVQGGQGHGPLANANLQMAQNPAPGRGVVHNGQRPINFGAHRQPLPNLQQIPNPQQNSNPQQIPNLPQLPPLPQPPGRGAPVPQGQAAPLLQGQGLPPPQLPPLPPAQMVGNYFMPTHPSIQGLQPPPAPQAAAVNPQLRAHCQADSGYAQLQQDLFAVAGQIVKATHTFGSERFLPVERLFKQGDDQAFRGLDAAARAYLQTVAANAPVLPQPPANDANGLLRQLQQPGLDSTTKKRLVADFITRVVAPAVAGKDAVAAAVGGATPLTAQGALGLVGIAQSHPDTRGKRDAALALAQALAATPPNQLGPIIQQLGAGGVDAMAGVIRAQVPKTSPHLDGALTALGKAVAAQPHLAQAYLPHAGDPAIVKTIILGQGTQGTPLTGVQQFRELVSRQLFFETSQQNDQTLFRGNSPGSRVLDTGLERAGQGYLSQLGSQLRAVVIQEVANAKAAGQAVCTQNAGQTMIDTAFASRVAARIMAQLDPTTIPQGLKEFNQFVSASIEGAGHLTTDGDHFVKTAVTLRGLAPALYQLGTTSQDPDEKAVAIAMSAMLQNLANGTVPHSGTTQHLAPLVQRLGQPNGAYDQWMNVLV